jgi:hypothetical protein
MTRSPLSIPALLLGTLLWLTLFVVAVWVAVVDRAVRVVWGWGRRR